ncbi:hypothetical protein [Solimonas sp. SE-A11]|uniref:hypothetical protein n=1 Tax=Solimonas sp. SE-A11 TaxID=3054954 RepID=UPI00259CB6D8|nr:hypothetical protein [Solimonas sp. SE-A11]MDM4772871.1 hypothetical protein [Solimonas sp. SE-A11]
MLGHKEYLRVEHAGVKQALNETLRHRFNDRYQKFYNECARRLVWIENAIEALDPDEGAPSWISEQLTLASELITRMERSHLEEFAWPFAEELHDLARAITLPPKPLPEKKTPKGASDPRTTLKQINPPFFFFTAEGGMASYSVAVNSQQFPTQAHMDIIPVIFPRSLKEHVLLHVVLAHEIGHVAYRTNPRGATYKIAAHKLLPSIPKDLYDWCYAHLKIAHPTPILIAMERYNLWAEEFFCDLFGLISMGPSFIPALLALLGPRDKTKFHFMPTHPPLDARISFLGYAAEALSMQYSKHKDGTVKLPVAGSLDKSFDKRLKQARSTPAGKLIDKKTAMAVTRSVYSACSAVDGVVFPIPEAKLMTHLVKQLSRHLPPSAPEIRYSEDAVGYDIKEVDFRHILFAGWLHWSTLKERDEEDMRKINQLCSKAILHQNGISFWNENLHAVRDPS